MSCEIWSSDWPAPAAISSFSRAFSRRISRRALSMSAAMPCTPAEAWWMRMRTACTWHPQEHRTHVGGHPDARGCDRGLDQVHGVVYGQPGVQRTTPGVDVHLNLVVGSFWA